MLFRLELPSKKSIGVKAKPVKLIREVLGPILNQYGWNLEGMSVRRDVPNSHGGKLRKYWLRASRKSVYC